MPAAPSARTTVADEDEIGAYGDGSAVYEAPMEVDYVAQRAGAPPRSSAVAPPEARSTPATAAGSAFARGGAPDLSDLAPPAVLVRVAELFQSCATDGSRPYASKLTIKLYDALHGAVEAIFSQLDSALGAFDARARSTRSRPTTRWRSRRRPCSPSATRSAAPPRTSRSTWPRSRARSEPAGGGSSAPSRRRSRPSARPSTPARSSGFAQRSRTRAPRSTPSTRRSRCPPAGTFRSARARSRCRSTTTGS
jgi:hypothetical protein